MENLASGKEENEAENIYRTLVEELPLPVALYTGREMRVSQVNKALLKVWGKDSSVIGKTFSEALPEMEGQPFAQILDEVYTSGIAYHAKEDKVDLVIDGQLQTFYFTFTYKPLKDQSGKVWGILNTATDVTELVLTRKGLSQAEEGMHFALDAAKLGTWDLDLLTNESSLDERCRELFGFTAEESGNYELLSMKVAAEDREKFRKSVIEALNPDGQGHYDVIFRTSSGENNPRWLRSLGRAYFNDKKIAYRFAGTIQDISRDIEAAKEQQKFLMLVENSSDLIGVTDLAGNVTYLNKAGQELVGLKSPAEYKRPSSDYLVAEDLSELQESINTAIFTKGRWTGEMRYRNFETGELIPCQLNAFVINDPETKEIIGMASVTRDLRFDRARNMEQQKLISLVENSADLMSILEPNGINSYINKAGRDLLGFENEEQALQMPISELHSPEDFELVKREVLPSLARDGRWAGKMMVKHLKTGEIFPVYNSSVRIDDPITGETLAVGAFMRDMRAEVAAQKAQAESEKLFRSITTAAPTALWLADENLSFTFVNQMWIDWTGEPLEKHLNKGWLDMIFKEDRQLVTDKLTTDFNARKAHESQFRLSTPDGEVRYVICTGNPQYHDNGSFSGYIGACVDITELNQLQRQKDEFIGIASHELKTPVTSIKAYAQVLESMFRNSGDEKKADMVKKMDLQINRLTNLIGDLLDVTKIQTGKLQLNDSDFDFNEMVRELIEDLQRTTKRHTIIEKYGETGVIYADRERIGQVITNLISNAIKYSPNAEKIVVTTSVEGNEIKLCVEDFGIGIPQDKRDKVFEQFYRVSGDKQHTFPGLGLGLYISSEIIRREGGRIWVNSQEGTGSKFCFSLPRDRR